MRYLIFIMLVTALLFVGCQDDPVTHTNAVNCTTDANCKGNTNGKTLCISDKCTEPAQVEDCATDDDCKGNTTNTKCVEAKCTKEDVVNCTVDDNCKDNLNGKIVCTDNKCAEPVQVEDCATDDDCKGNTVNTICTDSKCSEPETNTDDCTQDANCINNDNGKTVCNTTTSKCSEPNVVDCTDGGNECANNFNGEIVCNTTTFKCSVPNAVDCTDGGDECIYNFDGKVDCNTTTLKCAEPNATTCTDGGNECANNFDGKVACNTITFECVEPNAVDCTDGGEECIDNFDGNTVCDTETSKCVHVDAIECETDADCAQNRDSKTKCSTLNFCVDPACVSSEETCDGVDNNCDGVVDNGDLCDNYAEGTGQCTLSEDGTSASCTLLSCNEGFYNNDDDESNGCEYACTPIVGGDELCNSADDNCDGVIDEGFNLQEDPNNCGACNNVCGTYANAATLCTDGGCVMGACDEGSYDKDNDSSNGCEYACNYTSDEDADCDGLDNDCDGTNDEDADLTVVQNCGACGNNCADAVEDAYERTLFITCDGSCQYTCDTNRYNVDNDWSNGCEYSCTPTNSGVEMCDGLDNDCNGGIDDGITCNCTDGDSESCDVPDTNTCHSTRTCNNGNWETCTLNDYNHSETCDGLDNDCDGPVDEDFMTGDIYTDDNNCGACGQVCQDVHSNNSCTATGTCNPSCDRGWTDFNTNKFDGCETGCTAHNFGRDTYIKVAGGASGNDTEYADSIYADGKLAIVYNKRANPRNIYAKIVNKDGTDAVAEKALTDLAADKNAYWPNITKVGNYYHVSYHSNEDGNYDVYYRVYDSNLNVVTGKPRVNVSNGYDYAKVPYMAKDNYLANSRYHKLPMFWYESNAGHWRVHFKMIDTTTNTVDSTDHTILSYDSFYPKVATIGHTYMGVAYCHRIGGNAGSTSELRYASVRYNDGYIYKDIKLDSFSDDICKGVNNHSITSDGTYYYISYTNNDNDLRIKKFRYYSTGVYASHNLTSTIYKTAISYNNNNIVLAYTYRSRYYYLGTKRFDKSLNLKNTNTSWRRLSSEFSSNLNVFYTEDKKVLTQYSTNATSAGTDVEISITDECGN